MADEKKYSEQNSGRTQQPSANQNTQDPRIPKPGEKMDIPVPKRPGAEITIGPEGPYSSSYIRGEDTDAE
jgi:hypothetical protein